MRRKLAVLISGILFTVSPILYADAQVKWSAPNEQYPKQWTVSPEPPNYYRQSNQNGDGKPNPNEGSEQTSTQNRVPQPGFSGNPFYGGMR